MPINRRRIIMLLSNCSFSLRCPSLHSNANNTCITEQLWHSQPHRYLKRPRGCATQCVCVQTGFCEACVSIFQLHTACMCVCVCVCVWAFVYRHKLRLACIVCVHFCLADYVNIYIYIPRKRLCTKATYNKKPWC